MRDFERRLANLEDCQPAPVDEPEDDHEVFIEFLSVLPNGPALVASYREKVARKVAAGADTRCPPTAEDLPFIRLLIEALPSIMTNPKWIAALDEFHREHERQKRKSAARRGRG